MKNRRNTAGGVLVILLGLFLLAWQVMPDRFSALFGEWLSWPMIIIGVGLFFILAAALSGVGPLTIPGCIVGGIGFILAWQNATGNWESWAYIWPLIPGFVGLGLFLSSLFDPESRALRSVGLSMMMIAALVLIAFWTFFDYNLNAGIIWPVVLIILGLYMLFRALFVKSKWG